MESDGIFILYLVPIALFISFCWAIAPVGHKYVLQNTNASPATMLFLTFLFHIPCLILLIIFDWTTIKKEIKAMDTISFCILAIIAIISGFLANYIYFHVLRHHASSVVTALVYSSPIFTLILAYLIINERINKLSILGILMIVLGVVLIGLASSKKK